MYKKDITIGYACLECNKLFKKHRYVQNKKGDWEPVEYEVVCPQCSATMYEAGAAFKVPKSTDVKAWKSLKPLFESGYTFNRIFGNPFKESIDIKENSPNLPKSAFRKQARKLNKK